MSAETAINVFKKELEDAVREAHEAVDNVVRKLETYVGKGGTDVPQMPETPTSEDTKAA